MVNLSPWRFALVGPKATPGYAGGQKIASSEE